MTEPTSPQGADVHVPPPLVYAAPLVAAWAVDRLLPWRMPGRHWRTGAGWVLVVAGQAVAAAGASSFRRHHTSIIPGRPAKAMVTTGPYMYTRNPMYLGMAGTLLGAAVLMGSITPFVVIPAFTALISDRFILGEEAQMQATFGRDYLEYKARVRRWL